MAFNTRQANFIAKLRNACKDAATFYGTAFNLNETFKEEFSTGKDNDLSTMTTELAEWGLTYDAIQKACNQFFDEYVNFWSGDAVTTREYGKDARRVASNE